MLRLSQIPQSTFSIVLVVVNLQPTSATCVTVGSFNIYLFQPWWIGRLEHVDEVDEFPIQCEQDLSRPGFKFSADRFQCKWLVRPDRLLLEADAPDADCGRLMARVLEAIPVTPVMAIGHNFAWSDPNGSPYVEQIDFPVGGAVASDEPIRRGWTVSITQDQHVFNLLLAQHQGELSVSANIHRSLEAVDRDKRISLAIQSAQRHLDVRNVAADLIQGVFGVEIENDTSTER